MIDKSSPETSSMDSVNAKTEKSRNRLVQRLAPILARLGIHREERHTKEDLLNEMKRRHEEDLASPEGRYRQTVRQSLEGVSIVRVQELIDKPDLYVRYHDLPLPVTDENIDLLQRIVRGEAQVAFREKVLSSNQRLADRLEIALLKKVGAKKMTSNETYDGDTSAAKTITADLLREIGVQDKYISEFDSEIINGLPYKEYRDRESRLVATQATSSDEYETEASLWRVTERIIPQVVENIINANHLVPNEESSDVFHRITDKWHEIKDSELKKAQMLLQEMGIPEEMARRATDIVSSRVYESLNPNRKPL